MYAFVVVALGAQRFTGDRYSRIWEDDGKYKKEHGVAFGLAEETVTLLMQDGRGKGQHQ